MNKLHAVTDADGRALSLVMIAGQVIDDGGAAALLDDLPKAQWLLGDHGYDAEWLRGALAAKGIQPCNPGWRCGSEPVTYDTRRCPRLCRIEFMFRRLKDRPRRHSLRSMPTVFVSSMGLAATAIFWP